MREKKRLSLKFGVGVVLAVALAVGLAGCAPFLDQLTNRQAISQPASSDSDRLQPLSASSEASCVYSIPEPQRAQLL